MNFENAYTLIAGKLGLWASALIEMTPNLVLAVLIVLVAGIMARIARRTSHTLFARFSENEAINGLFATLMYSAVLLIGVFMALGLLKLDKTVTSLLAGAGIVGLALGFAFQDLAANFIAGIFMAIHKPIAVGDIIETNGKMGTVRAINLRSTELRLAQGPLAMVPNKEVFQQLLVNFTEFGHRRIDLAVGVSYGEDLERVKQITLEAIRALPQVEATPEVELFYTEFGASSINFEVCYWIQYSVQGQFRSAVSDGVMAIKRAFDANSITIPFPIRTLDFGIKGGERLAEVLSEVPSASPRIASPSS